MLFRQILWGFELSARHLRHGKRVNVNYPLLLTVYQLNLIAFYLTQYVKHKSLAGSRYQCGRC
ncbi:hypothetical protein COK_0636 [Mannheimia haemolytica serotype A2 str. BOVINE]|nr:hypothetical protein COK_0636 [Mannheimia haemolytica serotype A2 str. BOVINE]